MKEVLTTVTIGVPDLTQNGGTVAHANGIDAADRREELKNALLPFDFAGSSGSPSQRTISTLLALAEAVVASTMIG